MPDVQQWARVRGEVNCRLRRGAWYPVARLTPDEASLEVSDGLLRVPRDLLEIRTARPERWSVVPRPRDAVDLPLSWGPSYAVCPDCRQRRALPGHAFELRCPTCQGVFAVAWHDPS